MTDIFALVNEGGTPGTPGTGTAKTYNLKNLNEIGIGKKNVTEVPDFPGPPPSNNLLTAGMLAAGSIVDFGGNNTNGSWVRYESGLQLCFHSGILVRSSQSTLNYTWNFGKNFLVPPIPVGTITTNNQANMDSTKVGGSNLEHTTNFFDNVQFRLRSPNLFTQGAEQYGISMFAIGVWKQTPLQQIMSQAMADGWNSNFTSSTWG